MAKKRRRLTSSLRVHTLVASAADIGEKTLMRVCRRLVLLLTLVFTLVPLLAGHALAFTDVGDGNPYQTAINDLAARGIVSGYDDGTFRPENPVKRAQFAKMIDLTLELTPTEADICPFPDVESGLPGDLYPDHYVAVAAAQGFTQGYDDGTFRPYNSISRAQVLTMVMRAAQRLRPEILGPIPSTWQGVVDASDPTHGANLALAEFNQLLRGIRLQGWNTNASASRGEVAQVLSNLLWLTADLRDCNQLMAAEIDLPYSILRYRIVGDWAAGTLWSTGISVEALDILFERVAGHWTLIDYGTGLAADDYRAYGVPEELITWVVYGTDLHLPLP
jgi:S-layer homology domain